MTLPELPSGYLPREKSEHTELVAVEAEAAINDDKKKKELRSISISTLIVFLSLRFQHCVAGLVNFNIDSITVRLPFYIKIKR